MPFKSRNRMYPASSTSLFSETFSAAVNEKIGDNGAHKIQNRSLDAVLICSAFLPISARLRTYKA
jgi:hypothetical protein